MTNKITTLLLVGLVLGGTTIPATAFAESNSSPAISNTSTTNSSLSQADKAKEIIKPFLFKASDGTIKIKPMDESLYVKYHVKELENYLDSMNKKVLSGQVKVTNNFDYVPTSNLYALSTSSGWTAHWYGYDASLDDQDTKSFVANCEAIAAGTASATAIFPELAPFTGVAAGYFGLLAQRVSSNNNGKGVYIAITWTGLFYSEPLA